MKNDSASQGPLERHVRPHVPAWWSDGLAETLMREGVNKHRAKEIAVGYWEQFCAENDELRGLLRDASAQRWECATEDGACPDCGCEIDEPHEAECLLGKIDDAAA